MLWACPMSYQNWVLHNTQSAWQWESKEISPTSVLLAVAYGFTLPAWEGSYPKGVFKYRRHCTAKLKPNLDKGYSPYHSQHITLWSGNIQNQNCNPYVMCAKGMKNLPLIEMPPNIAHLIRTNDGQPVLPDIAELSASNFAFWCCPLCTNLQWVV